MEVDVIVAGGGLGGLTAALTAQETGARVVLLEKAPEIGGSAAASGGTLWCAIDLDSWRSVQPGGDDALGTALIESFFEGIPWIRAQGVPLEELPDWKLYKMPRIVYAMRPNAAVSLATLGARFVERGGVVLTGNGLQEVLLDQHSAVRGVRTQADVEVAAPAVVLATGGFQGDVALRQRHMGPWASRMILRANPHSAGDGLRAATAVGAATAGPFDRFYGHMLPAPPARVGLHNFAQVKPDFSETAIFVNLHGDRFDDEFLGDEVTVHTAVRQPQALVFLVFDETIRAAAMPAATNPRPGANRLQNIRDAGGEILEAPSLAELAAQLAARWGVAADRLQTTVAAYNAAARTGNGAALQPPKSGGLVSLETPPFYAIRLLPGITFTYGGVRVDSRAQVLDAAANPIRGLYAAGADVGGVYTRGYTGGLALGLAFGRLAGRHAAAPVLLPAR